MIAHVPLFSVQPLSCRWRSRIRKPPCRAFTPTPPACSPRTSPTAGKSAPSTTLRPLRTTSSPSSREKSSPSWTIGESLHTHKCGEKQQAGICHMTERIEVEVVFKRILQLQTKPMRSKCSTEKTALWFIYVGLWSFFISVTPTGGKGKRTREWGCSPPTLSQLTSLLSLRWVSTCLIQHLVH